MLGFADPQAQVLVAGQLHGLPDHFTALPVRHAQRRLTQQMLVDPDAHEGRAQIHAALVGAAHQVAEDVGSDGRRRAARRPRVHDPSIRCCPGVTFYRPS
jgi:hypothetical protein